MGYSSGVAGVAKREEGHWDGAKMGAGVGNTLVALLRARFGCGYGGGTPLPPDSAPLVIRPQGASPAKSAQALIEQQAY